MKSANDRPWTEDFLEISSVIIPFSLILLSVFTPNSLVSSDQKDTLLTAGLTALVTGGFRGMSRRTNVTQEVQNQEMNLGSSNDYVAYNPPSVNQPPYLSQVDATDEPYIDTREHVASSPYKVVEPDED
jgi:hypothetical protein